MSEKVIYTPYPNRELHRRHGPNLLVFRRSDWMKIRRTIKKHGSKRLSQKLKELGVNATPVQLRPPEEEG